MRRISFIFILLLTWVTSGFAEDKLQVESFSISAGGTATLNIALSNPDAQYTALQADLYLPEGIDLEKQGDDYVYTLSRVADSHSLTIKKKTGYYRLLLSSVKNEEFSGNSGSLISLSLKAAAEISSETKTGYLKAIKIAKKDGSGLIINESAYNVSIVSIQITPPSAKTDLVYSGISQDLISKGSTSTGTMLYSTDGTNYSFDIPTGKDAKTYTIYYKVVDNSNKDIVTPVSLTVTIEKAALKISAGDYTINQGEQLPNFVAKYEGFKNNETEDVLTKKPVFSTTATSSSEPGTYEVKVNNAEAQNYNISYVNGSLTIKAGKYKLIYMIDGEVYKTYEIEYGATITPEAAPTKEGYTFSGWSSIPVTMPAKDVTITGTFTINKYKLIYKVDGEVYKTYEIEYGKTIIPEAAPTKEGYSFSGWSSIPEAMPAKDVVVTGTFSKGSYKLTYMVDGAVYKTVSYDYGDRITPEAAPTKEGYTFSGWSTIPATMPAKDVTVTGTFTINKYKLTYMVDGAVYKTYEIEYGKAITPEPAPTKETYVFSGWSEIPETMPEHDVIVTGTFERHFDVGHVVNVVNFIMNANATPEDIALYDMNNDNELNIGDIILVLKLLLSDKK